MRPITVLIAVIVAASLVVPAAAQTTVVVPRYTVIPVTTQDTISSSTGNVGDTFRTQYCTANCPLLPLPAGTVFIGRITCVTRAAKKVPGQIDVQFVQAILPDGARLDINGRLTSLNSSDITTNPTTGVMTRRPEVRDKRNTFLAYGAGAGFVIGALAGDTLKGTGIGAIAGYLGGLAFGKQKRYTDVTVPAGTPIGIALDQDLVIPVPVMEPPSAGAGTGAGVPPPPEPTTPPTPGWSLTFAQHKPYSTANGVLMVPFREFMSGINMEFIYNKSTQTVIVNTSGTQIVHNIGTDVVFVGNETVIMKDRSRVVDGTLYVPADFVRILTGKTATWNAKTGVLNVY